MNPKNAEPLGITTRGATPLRTQPAPPLPITKTPKRPIFQAPVPPNPAWSRMIPDLQNVMSGHSERVAGDEQDEPGEDLGKQAALAGQRPPRAGAEQAARDAAGDEDRGQPQSTSPATA